MLTFPGCGDDHKALCYFICCVSLTPALCQARAQASRCRVGGQREESTVVLWFHWDSDWFLFWCSQSRLAKRSGFPAAVRLGPFGQGS